MVAVIQKLPSLSNVAESLNNFLLEFIKSWRLMLEMTSTRRNSDVHFIALLYLETAKKVKMNLIKV